MSNLDFYKKIRDMHEPGAWALHVIDGAHKGEKALASAGNLIWTGEEDGFFASNQDELMQKLKPGTFELDGHEIYAELLGNKSRLIICGAGHISMAMVDMGRMIGFEVTVIDDRLQFVNNAIARGADNVLFNDFEKALAEIEGDKDSYFVIATRGHRYDIECLHSIIAKEHAYIGMLGSKRRVAIIKKDLAEAGVSYELIESIHMPIGLSIGAETPEEIAVAVMAEIIEVKNRRSAAGFESELLEAILNDDRDDMVLATIVSKKGSAPREAGTKMLVSREGSIIGTIGGGCIEGGVIAKARRMLTGKERGPLLMEVDVTTEAAEDEGMVCGGKVTVMLERL